MYDHENTSTAVFFNQENGLRKIRDACSSHFPLVLLAYSTCDSRSCCLKLHTILLKSPENSAALRASLKCTGFDLLKCKCFTGREMCANLLESINLASFLDLLRLTATKLLVKLGLKKAIKCCTQYNAVRTKMYYNHSKNTARKRHEHYHVNRSDVPKAKRHAVPSERRYDHL